MTQDWDALATAVRRRREKFGLRQADLEQHGGPSHGTVRNIEQAARTKYSSRTFASLETALDWRPGTVERILSGEIAAELDGTPFSSTDPNIAVAAARASRRRDGRGVGTGDDPAVDNLEHPGGQALARATHQVGQALAGDVVLIERTPRVARSIELLNETFKLLLDEQINPGGEPQR